MNKRSSQTVTYNGKMLMAFFVGKSKDGYVLGITEPRIIQGENHLTVLVENGNHSWHITDKVRPPEQQAPRRDIDMGQLDKELTEFLDRTTVPYGHHTKVHLIPAPVMKKIGNFREGIEAKRNELSIEFLKDELVIDFAKMQQWKTTDVRNLLGNSGFGVMIDGEEVRTVMPIDEHLMLSFRPGEVFEFLAIAFRHFGGRDYLEYSGLNGVLEQAIKQSRES